MKKPLFILLLILFTSAVKLFAQWVQTGPVINFDAMATNGSVVLIGTSRFTLFRSIDEGATWVQSSIGVGSTTINALGMKGSLAFAATASGIPVYRSSDEGITWGPSSSGISGQVKGFAFIGDTVFAGTSFGSYGAVYRSTNKGMNWSLSGPTMTYAPTGAFLVMGNVIYAGGANTTNGGALYRSTNFGAGWERVGADSITQGVESITAIGNSIYVVQGWSVTFMNGHVWRTDDGGTTWSRVTVDNGFPVSAPTGILNANGTLLTGSVTTFERGMYASRDGGNSWRRENQGLPTNWTNAKIMVATNSYALVALGGTSVYGVYRRAISNLTTEVKKIDTITPQTFALEQNYPNPFNPETTIWYTVLAASQVSLKVYDVLGNEVATLIDEYKSPGIYNSQFSIRNSQFPSGVYFYKLQAGSFSSTKKMLLIK